MNAPSFTCPRCGAVSYNLNDIRERYCGRCHIFTEDAASPDKRWRCWQCFDSNISNVEECPVSGCVLRKQREAIQ